MASSSSPIAHAPTRDDPKEAPFGSLVVGTEKNPQAKKLLRKMMKTITAWELVAPGDRIMVALSGGKDSYTLFDLLWQAKQKAPFDFDLIGVHLDQVQPGYEPSAFYQWLEDFGAPFEIVREDTYSVVKEKTKPGQATCFICSRLRRGILYSVAERLGCNKIALGHHRDDALETLLMNLFFAGKMQAMPARYLTDDEKFTVIRPLIEVGEEQIAAWSEQRGYPIIPCNLCGSQDGLKRDEMKQLLADLSTRYPDVRQVMLHALQNVRPSHLLDADVDAAWAARPVELRDNGRKPNAMGAGDKDAPWRHQGEVVLRGGLLPIVD
jgi:tRNA 2-thiocytidine biosynthesis protein TtcA